MGGTFPDSPGGAVGKRGGTFPWASGLDVSRLQPTCHLCYHARPEHSQLIRRQLARSLPHLLP